MTFTPAHKPAGTPDGGQFTAPAHSDAVPALQAPPNLLNPYRDADGTRWESGGDEYQDTFLSSVGGIEARVTTDIREEGARAEVIDYRGNRPLTISQQQHFASLDEAKEHAKAARTRAHNYGVNHLSEGSRTPWGKAQGTSPMAAGIDAVWTAGHGGIKLSPERDAEVDPAWREPAGMYERDCAWAKATITHHQDLNPVDVKNAHTIARRYYPDEYTEIVGKDPARYGLTAFEPITAAESMVIRDREFHSARAATHDKVTAVVRDPEGHPGMIAITLADIPADGRINDNEPAGNNRTVLVRQEEWPPAGLEKLTLPKSSSLV
ncbi:hypothetical protein [Pseudarthrobacter sp. BIM B-2242]|uniref:DUF7007 domain-containing protein n=1 Tax=Pseudarthrobacter sp. BIM B-2242 TaxID=2772401 RepID=UPI00168AD477|nr:hypothetical protein [Pseudarthrobacter sp. BIM B-2242]QOD06096.1 hypothetical protein IDT60_21275 [Pseudarthrobacter sp. BIM B-2242]